MPTALQVPVGEIPCASMSNVVVTVRSAKGALPGLKTFFDVGCGASHSVVLRCFLGVFRFQSLLSVSVDVRSECRELRNQGKPLDERQVHLAGENVGACTINYHKSL